MPSILLVDDDPAILDLLTRFLDRRGWHVYRSATGTGAIRTYEEESPDLVLLDLELPDLNGIPVLGRLRELDEDVTVIMLTGHADVETAVEAMRLGAENFLTKPFELDHLAAVVDRAEEKSRLRRYNRVLAGTDGRADSGSLGVSPMMTELNTRLERIAVGDGTVLLQGETGTGKGWAARRIHERSARRTRPFVEVNCGGLSATFLESELFGHEKGAFTDARARKEGLFEIADGGTIFLDEIGDLAPELQPKLLKVLEDRRFRRLGGTREISVDVRLIAASHHDLRDKVRKNEFREDLYYRIAVLPLELPPLRERRRDDVARLIYDVLEELRRRIQGGPSRIDDRALDALVRHRWPGNIRELRNLIERILILATDDDVIRLGHLPAEIRGGGPVHLPDDGPMTLEEVERRHIARILELNDGNRSRSARALGISRAALYDKMDRFGLRAVGC
jgi:two-component system, NtrC family, response regulator AtoC